MKSFIILTVACSFAASSVFAISGSTGSVFVVSPGSLRSRLIDANTSVLAGLNQVYRAKEEVNIARGSLLPFINAGAMVTVGGIFSLTQVSFLLPFLLPSNWYNLEAARSELVADGHAFYLVELNQFASAYSLYSTLLGDLALKEIYSRQAANYEQIRQIEQDRESVGAATASELRRATSQALLARNQVSQVESLIHQEKASLKKLLALPLSVDLEIAQAHVPALSEEKSSPQTLLDRVYPRSPEAAQINALINAGNSRTESRAYSFLTGASLSIPGTGGQLSWNNANLNGAAGIGFGYFPSIRASQLTVRELTIRRKEIRLEQARILESTLFSVSQAVQQLRLATEAEENMNQAYQSELESYQNLQSDLLHLLDVANAVTAASVARVRAQVDLDGNRISLQRVLIVDQFSMIRKCLINSDVLGDTNWFEDLFGMGSATQISVDQVCRRQSRRNR